MTKNRQDFRVFHEAQAIQFVTYLGLWTFPNVKQALRDGRRDPQEYIRLLKICARQERDDPVSAWEKAAARRALTALKVTK